MLKSLLRLCTVVILFLLLVASQATRTLAGTTGGVNGTITDSANHPVAGVQVTAVAPSYRTGTLTGSNGFYAISGMPPDTYALTYSKSGYQTQTVPGITINQDQVYTQNLVLVAEVKTIGRIPVRASTALVQPTLTVNQYTINPQSVQNITGTPQNLSETAVLNALPGITTDNGGYPIIRGGAENDEGFELEGIDATEPITGQFINSLVLNGVGRLQLSTGGYDVSEGNTNSGVVNIVTKRGAYPGAGEGTARLNWPNNDHRLALDYGNATPDNRFSYYFSFQGSRTQVTYGDDKTFLPRLVGDVNYEGGNDFVSNLFYHWGANSSNELQYYADAGDNLFNEAYLLNPALTPYATANGVNQIISGLGTGLFADPTVSLIDFAPMFPGQVGLIQNTAYPDHEDENHTIQKLNYKHQFNASSFGEFRVFRAQSTVNFLLPWDVGALTDQYEYDVSDNRGVAFDYSNQLNSQHEITLGGETIFTKPRFRIAVPSATLFTDPLECGISCALLGLTGTFNPNAPQGYVGPLYNQTQAALGLPPGLPAPLSQLPDQASYITDDIHRSNVYLKDRWQPNDRWTVTAGVRWDQEVINLPSNAQSQNLFYAQDALGNFVDIRGQAIGTDVTQPSQISPRIAISYAANSRDVFKTSYGRFIEFTPVSNIENTYNVEASAASCTIANGCFTPLPGYSPTCVNGVDPANANAGCNGINNLRQQIIEDLNKNNFAQYTPVRPQKASSIDFSWEHDFGNGLQLKISPYYRKGTDYVVASTPLLFTLPDGTSVFGSPRESNAGVNKNTGVEFALDKLASYGWSGFIHGTYDNTIANYNSDFFPSVNQAAVDLGHFFHVSYLAPVTAHINVNYNTRSGWHFIGDFPYESGYRYGVGKKTFIYLPTGPGGALQANEVLNTNLAASALGLNSNTSAYYFTDPTNPGTILSPNIIGSRGTNEGDDPGSLSGPARMFVNLTVARDVGEGPHNMQIGLHVANLLGNYSNGVVGGNSTYRNNGFGGFGPTSGNRSAFLAAFEPYVFNRSPNPYENEPTGPARLWTLYLNAKY